MKCNNCKYRLELKVEGLMCSNPAVKDPHGAFYIPYSVAEFMEVCFEPKEKQKVKYYGYPSGADIYGSKITFRSEKDITKGLKFDGVIVLKDYPIKCDDKGIYVEVGE